MAGSDGRMMQNIRNKQEHMAVWETYGKKLYKCDICGKTGNWSDDWQWFGSYKDYDDGKALVFTCSEDCRKKVKHKELLKIQKEKEEIFGWEK